MEDWKVFCVFIWLTQYYSLLASRCYLHSECVNKSKPNLSFSPYAKAVANRLQFNTVSNLAGPVQDLPHTKNARHRDTQQ